MILKEVDVLEGNVALAANVIIADVELSLLEIQKALVDRYRGAVGGEKKG